MTPEEIYAESFRIIEAEAPPHAFGPAEWAVVRRMVHASGDLDLVRSVVFTNGAAAAGVSALRRGTTIVTDVSMVLAGVSKPYATALGVPLRCFLDDADVPGLAAEAGNTRSACAMRKALAEVGDAVYVVGNAPTALLALCDAVRDGLIRPRLVAAMPVGFVAAEESKEQALGLLGVPVVAVRGRKGGSAVAAAAVNALLRLAAGEDPA